MVDAAVAAAVGFTAAVVVADVAVAVPDLATGFAAAWVEGDVAAADAAAGFSVAVIVVDVPVLVAVSVAFAAGFATVAWVEGEIVALVAVIVVFGAVGAAGAFTVGLAATSLAATSEISREVADTVAEAAAVFAEVEPPATVFLEAVDLATFFVI